MITVYVSMDLSKEQFEDHVKEMANGWLVLPYGDPRRDIIKEKFGTVAIPQLVIFEGSTGNLIEINAKQ